MRAATQLARHRAFRVPRRRCVVPPGSGLKPGPPGLFFGARGAAPCTVVSPPSLNLFGSTPCSWGVLPGRRSFVFAVENFGAGFGVAFGFSAAGALAATAAQRIAGSQLSSVLGLEFFAAPMFGTRSFSGST